LKKQRALAHSQTRRDGARVPSRNNYKGRDGYPLNLRPGQIFLTAYRNFYPSSRGAFDEAQSGAGCSHYNFVIQNFLTSLEEKDEAKWFAINPESSVQNL